MIGQMIELTRLKSSVNGNPRYVAKIIDINGDITKIRTAPDCSLGYSIGNYEGKFIEYETRMLRNYLTFTSIKKHSGNVLDEWAKYREYINSEFNSLSECEVYKIQVIADVGKTKFINVSRSQLTRVRDILANA